jgi:hypothetical protein
MGIHDWTRVDSGVFHDFHHSWIEELKRSLNRGILPAQYYAMAEQSIGKYVPDVLTLQKVGKPEEEFSPTLPGGSLALAPPPAVRFTAITDMANYLAKQNTVVVRHVTGDRIVALIEVVSPGNKASRQTLERFVEKAASVLILGQHLLILDLLPPGPRDPNGIHGAIWEEIENDSYRAPADKPLTLAAYASDGAVCAYVEPVAVGDRLPDMPLFLTPDACVHVPLEATYQSAWSGVPRRWQDVLE